MDHERSAAPGDRLASLSAQVLIFGAGLVTTLNATLSRLPGVNTSVLRTTGLSTMLAAFAVALLPWSKHPRVVSNGITVAALIALVGTDQLHHFSRSDAAIAVYPLFFVLVIAFAGLTQPRGTATIVACVSGAGLAWLLTSGGRGGAAWQCVIVTVPAAAILGEVICWSYGRALLLGRLDASRRNALESLVSGTSQLQHSLTVDESKSIVIAIASAMFSGRDTRYEPASPLLGHGAERDDAYYDESTRELRIELRGQSGVLGTIITSVAHPDTFTLDAARLFSRHVGSRLEQLRLIDALADAASSDALTGVGNRRAAQASLENIAAGDAVFMLDLDHFKSINDDLGHQAGDRVLAEFGEFLRSVMRPTDSVTRYGGEEFLLICTSVTPDDAALLADRLLDQWRARRPLVTFSIGYAVHIDNVPPDITIEHADMALYEAKRMGRDRACVYQATPALVNSTEVRRDQRSID